MSSRESRPNAHVFTRREQVILHLIAEGYEDKEIADELFISENAVREIQTNLMRKLNARSMSSVIEYGLEKGLISIYKVLESRYSRRGPSRKEVDKIISP